MKEIEALKLYRTSELEELLGVDRHVIYRYREAGLLKMRKVKNSWRSSGEEIREFYKLTEGLDISNELKIQAAGQMIRKNRQIAAAGRTTRSHQTA